MVWVSKEAGGFWKEEGTQELDETMKNKEDIYH